ncbi:MAG TPA: DUF3352 domain-containing protein [Solirubrobacteraceae bacterium]|nr:DUF3352 domain-containing protein [Solirubrobacteraceae bacterium]
MSPARSFRFCSTRLLPAAAAAALTLAAVSGCGSSSPGGTSASPASVVPASAPLYVDAVLRPSGALKSDALGVGRRLTGRTNPFAGLLALLQGPTGKTPSYGSEVKPWLGPEGGVFLSSIGAGAGQSASAAAQQLLQQALGKALAEGFAGAEAALLGSEGLPHLLRQSSLQGALVLDTTDVGKARSFLEAQARGAGAHAATLDGVSFEVAPDGIAEGVVHRFAVIGSEAGVKSVIATAAGGAALARAAAYGKLTATAEPGRLANAYLDVEALTPAAKASGASNNGRGGGSNTGAGNSGGSGESLLALLRGVLGDPGQVYASLIPTASTVALDVDTLPPASGASSSGESTPSGADVLRGLPGGAWLALGVGDLGKELGGGAQGLSALASLASTIKIGSFGIGAAFAPLRSRAIDVRRDLLSWMGATGVYVSGSSILNLQAAVVIDSTNPALSRAAVAKLASAYREAGGQIAPTSIPGTETAVTVKLPNFPLALTLADGQGKFVLGLGQASVQEALSPQSTLAGSALYQGAASALGQGIAPSAAIEFHTLSGLIESLGLNQAPGFSGIASALAPLQSLAAGTGESLSDGVKRARAVLGLQAAG